MKLYRAHSRHYLTSPIGYFPNPNMNRERKPRDTPIQLHNALGDWFLSKFGINYRSKSLFCTGNIDIAKGYIDERNALIEITPYGQYSICFSENCKDLFGHFQFTACGDLEDISNVNSELELLDFVEFKNSGLDIAAATGNEVMIFAESFKYKKL